MINTLAVAGYRSLRDVVVPLGRLTVVTGANGSGKSSLYRALRLLVDVAHGQIIRSLAEEGGMTATLWAGPEKFSAGMKVGEVPIQGTRRLHSVALRLGFASDDFGYAIDLGLPPPPPPATRFSLDPDIKVEALWIGAAPRAGNLLAERRGPLVRVRDLETGSWRSTDAPISGLDSMLLQQGGSREGLELLMLRERMRRWRFYDDLRVDRDAPARRPGLGTYTPALASDGADLGSAVQTIFEIGSWDALADTITDAFDATIEVDETFDVRMRQPGLLRGLGAAELSGGTLRYLLLATALLSPRPPELLVLNEPEASLHPDLLDPLARLIARASQQSQILIVTHAEPLVRALEAMESCTPIRLEKCLGETIMEGPRPDWSWLKR